MTKSLILILSFCISFAGFSQTTWQVCVEDPASTTCPGKTGTFTPGNLVIQQGDMIQFNTTTVLLSGYTGTLHDIQFTGSAANNVTLLVSSDILNQNTSVTTPPFNTPGIFPMECANFNHCILSEYSCTGYTVEVQASCTLTAGFSTTSLNYCTGDIINFTNTSSGATAYTWHLDEFTFATSTNAVLSFGSAGTHDIELIADDGAGCLDSTEITINIDQASDAGADNTAIFCNINDSIDLNSLVSGTSGGNWLETTSSGQFNASNGIFNYSSLTPGIYAFDYFLLGTGSCPNDTANIQITINQEPNLNLMLTGTTIPSSDSLYINFTSSGILGTASFLWNFCDGILATDTSPFYYQWTTPGNQCVCVQVNNGNNCVETFCDSTVFIVDDSGIDVNQIAIEIYPNPADDFINVNFEYPQYGNIIIWDSANRLIENIQVSGESQLQIEMSSLPSGVYWIQFTNDTKNNIRKIVIQ